MFPVLPDVQFTCQQLPARRVAQVLHIAVVWLKSSPRKTLESHTIYAGFVNNPVPLEKTLGTARTLDEGTKTTCN